MKTNNTKEWNIESGQRPFFKHFYPFPFSCSGILVCTVQSGALFAAGVAAIFLAFDIRFTFTDSLPIGLYRSVPGVPIHDSLVSICLQDELASLAKDRGYGRPGRCPGDIAPLLKRVVAMPGDAVLVTDAGLTVNGIKVSNTARMHYDSQGRAIPMIETGIYRADKNELWLIANHNSRSWDSRYFGPLPLDQVQSVMKPLVTWSN